MDFNEAETRYHQLRAQLQAGAIGQQQFRQAVTQLRVLDAQRRHWTIEASTGRWLWYDGQKWQPSGRQVSAPPVARPAPRRRQTGWWPLILALGALVAICFLALGTLLFFGDQIFPPPAGQPTVAINAPPSGSQVTVGQEVAVQAAATDAQGVTRVELWVDGALADTILSPNPQGQPYFLAAYRWTPTVMGSHTLMVKAYNVAGTASQPVSVMVKVVTTPATPPQDMPTPPAPATPSPGVASLTVIQSGASVQKESSGPWLPAEKQMVVSAGDRIRTDATGRAVITFLAGNTTELGPGTDLTIQDLQLSRGQPPVVALYLWLGATWNRVVRFADPASRFEIETPSATVTVRGTAYRVSVDAERTTVVSVQDGMVAVVGAGRTVEVRAGQGTVVKVGQAPLPPRPIGQLTPTPTPTLTPEPTPTVCQPDAAFVADVTMPDGTQVGPAQRIDKVWRLRNTGNCAWTEGYRLVFVSGAQMAAPPAVSVPPAHPGQAADIGVTLYAPSTPGTYTGQWRMQTGEGVPFGLTVHVQIVVPAPPTFTPTNTPTPPPTWTPTPTPTPTSLPPASIDFWADDYDISSNDCTTLRWVVDNVKAVFLEGEGKPGHGEQTVCPDSTTTYTLRVVKVDGSEEVRQVTINVSAPYVPYYQGAMSTAGRPVGVLAFGGIFAFVLAGLVVSTRRW